MAFAKKQVKALDVLRCSRRLLEEKLSRTYRDIV
jgi:hypothetical protein